jgi:hypothetical protein
MRLSLSPDKQASLRQSQRMSWLEISLLIMLSAAILRLGSDLANQWRQTAERIGLVEANLHARSAADYSADPFGIYIPALDPAIIIDLLGRIPAIGDLPFGLPGGISDQPDGAGNQTPTSSITPLPTHTPTSHASDPTDESTATLPATISPTANLSPTATTGSQASATYTQAVTITRTPTQTPEPEVEPTLTPTRIISPSATLSKTVVPPTTEVPPPTTVIPTTVVPTTVVPTTAAPPPTTAVPTTAVPAPTTVTPPSKTPTPFATRNPTNALTPTAFYTPGVTIAPNAPLPPLGDSTCGSAGSVPTPGDDCLTKITPNGAAGERSFWQALLDLLRLDLGRGFVNTSISR